MRILKKTLSITALLLLLLVAGVTVFDPLLFKILWYRVPVKETYTIFPQHFLTPAKVPFNFIKVKYPRNDLDTLHVRNGADSLIQLSQYIKQGKINAFIVIRNDSILYERYNNGLTDTTMVALFSVAKSMLSMAVGHAVDAGKIHIEKRVIEYVPELKANPAFNNITIGHLLSMRSGLDFKGTEGNFLDALLSDEARYYYTDDMKASLLSLKLVNRPGTVWKYKSVDAILLGWALEQATGKTLPRYFEENIWHNIGSAYRASWGEDKKGMVNTASRFQASAADLAKLGKLFLQKGSFNGKQVLPASWIARSLSVPKGAEPIKKGWWKPSQQNLWWIPLKGSAEDYTAEGMLGQRLYVDPVTNTIIVQLAEKGAGDYPYRKIARYLAHKEFNYPE